MAKSIFAVRTALMDGFDSRRLHGLKTRPLCKKSGRVFCFRDDYLDYLLPDFIQFPHSNLVLRSLKSLKFLFKC